MRNAQAKEAGRVLAAEMKSADLDSDGRIDFREFIMYFERLARWRAQQARAGRLNARQNSAVPPGGHFFLRKICLLPDLAKLDHDTIGMAHI